MIMKPKKELKSKESAATSEKTKDDQDLRAQQLNSIKFPSNFPSHVKFYFGSQSGTAEKLCTVLDEEAKSLKIFDSTQVVNFEDFDENKFGQNKDELNLILVATHYEGEPCDNTAKFYSWVKSLKKDGAKKHLQNMSFAIFGLGDTAYEQFNAMGKYFVKVFPELGATMLHTSGEGNSELQLTDQQFDEWKNDLWEKLAEHYRKSSDGQEKKQSVVKVVAKDEMNIQFENIDDPAQNEEIKYDLASRQHQLSKKVKILGMSQLR